MAPARAARYPGTIRIIGGQWRGRKLKVLESPGLRPTPNRVRETVFNWLRPHLPGARCLDVTAGTGALCFEALSQGAGEAVLVELSPAAAARLKDNAALLGARATVVQGDALAFLNGPVSAFDIVFLDPPFASDLVSRASELMDRRGWVRPGALVYIEAPSSVDPLPIPSGWKLIKSQRSGQVGYHLAEVSETHGED